MLYIQSPAGAVVKLMLLIAFELAGKLLNETTACLSRFLLKRHSGRRSLADSLRSVQLHGFLRGISSSHILAGG